MTSRGGLDADRFGEGSINEYGGNWLPGPDGLVPVACWCGRKVVRVAPDQVGLVGAECRCEERRRGGGL